jgi:phage shock protein E
MFKLKSIESMFGFFQSKPDLAVEARLRSMLENGAFLVDVRTPGEFSGGTAPGAVNIPLDTLPNAVSKFKGKTGVVVFCRSGNRSAQAAAFLTEQGIENVMNGGTWQTVAALVK